MREQYCCNYRLSNQQHLLPLTPLDCLNSHKMENKYPWRCTCKCSNISLHNSQDESIDKARVFNFDPDAIQILEDAELQQLPKAINREIVKNSQEIVFEEKEGDFEKNLIKLHSDKNKNRTQEIVSEEGKDVLLQTAVKRNIINKEQREILNSQKIIFKEEKKDISTQTALSKLDRKNKPDLEKNLSLKKVVFEKKKDFLEKNMIELNKDKLRMLQNSQEIISKKREGTATAILERKLVKSEEEKVDSLKNTQQICEKEANFVKIKENRKNSNHQINYTLYKPERLSNRRCQQISLVNSAQQKLKQNFSFNEKQKSQEESDRTLIDDSFIINDSSSFKESSGIAIDNINVTTMEDRKFLKEIKKYPTVSTDHSNNSLIFRQRLNSDVRFRRGNSIDNITIENEKTMKSLSHRPAKIAIQHKFDPNDTCSLTSPASDLSFESGFCEESPDSSYRESYLFTKTTKKIDKKICTENNIYNSSQSNLLQKDISDVNNSQKSAKDQIV